MSWSDYLPSFVGGLMLSASTSTWLVNDGRVFGISGLAHSVISSTVPVKSSDRATDSDKTSLKPTARAPAFKYAAVAGLLAGGAVLSANSATLAQLTGRPVFDQLSNPPLTLVRVLVAGLATGIGTKLGSGCTSGHMLCGLSRLSKRSLVATLSFFSVALATAHLAPSPVVAQTLKLGPSLALTSIASLQLPLILAHVVSRMFDRSTSQTLSAFLTGMHFSFALALAGMLRPSTVISFFYVAGLPTPTGRAWDPSLMFVALGGLLPNMLVWQNVKNWSKPLLNSKWELPTRRHVDGRLVFGSALFGLGWGLMGICPGPLLAVLGSGTSLGTTTPFAIAFAAGGLLVDALL
ncbi:hypothetical protein OIO90_001321 [Microbotryomycetes sp. JL221]|nr:hypothetical protein OIO90_001321 [Microbotryomycetes sp. JL221]